MYLLYIIIYIIFSNSSYHSNNSKYIYIMPQLVPFYFINEISYAFIIIISIIFISSKYILPSFVRLFMSRTLISKLF